VLGKPLFHDGRWGMATLEVRLAMMQSARERKEIMLTHQVAVPPDHDADLEI
jgi:phthalate 4,5-cis-dihydrodiol dehydrogenase